MFTSYLCFPIVAIADVHHQALFVGSQLRASCLLGEYCAN